MVERETDELQATDQGYRSLEKALRQLDTSFLSTPSFHSKKIDYGGGFYFDPQEERLVFCETCSKNGHANGQE